MKIETCYPGLMNKQEPETERPEAAGGEVMEEATEVTETKTEETEETCGNCGYCIFCLTRCVRCGNRRVLVNFFIHLFYSNNWGNEIRLDWDHENPDKPPLLDCGYGVGGAGSPERPSVYQLQGAIWSLLKLPSRVSYRNGKVVATSWATTSPQL